MHKIASPRDLQHELNALLAYARTEAPSRARIASRLGQLADRVACTRTSASRAARTLNWGAPNGVEPSVWKNALEVYQRILAFLSPPWNANARTHLRFDANHRDLQTLDAWLSGIADLTDRPINDVEVAIYRVENTAQMAALLKQVEAQSAKIYHSQKSEVFEMIDRDGHASIRAGGNDDQRSEAFRHMAYDGLIEWDHRLKGFIRKS